MSEKIPRRLMRFERKNNSNSAQEDYAYSQVGGYGQLPEESSSNAKAPLRREALKSNPLTGQGQMPSMNYEDVASSKKNEQEKRKQAQVNLEKIALGKVEEFKKQYNRMPNKEEADQMAENLYSQFKNTNLEHIYPEDENMGDTEEQNLGRRGRRGRHEERNQQKAGAGEQKTPAQSTSQQPQINTATADLKALLGEEGKKSKKSVSDEFDLNLEEDSSETSEAAKSSSEEIGEIEDIALGDKSICPNCGKETEKIIFCSKCGYSFCELCSKKDGTKYICPKCKTKNEA